MASTFYKGKLLRFSFEGKTLFHATSCELSIDTKLEDIATKDTDGTISEASNYSWSISTECLVANKPVSSTQSDALDIVAYQLAGTEIDVEFATSVVGDFVLAGKVLVQNAKITAQVDNVATGSFTFKGNGNLTKTIKS